MDINVIKMFCDVFCYFNKAERDTLKDSTFMKSFERQTLGSTGETYVKTLLKY